MNWNFYVKMKPLTNLSLKLLYDAVQINEDDINEDVDPGIPEIVLPPISEEELWEDGFGFWNKTQFHA